MIKTEYQKKDKEIRLFLSNFSADFCCVWKLLGEALAMFHHFPNQVTNIEIPAELLDDQDNSKGDKIKADKRQLLSLASKCFVRALKIQPDNVSCWQDLAISYHYQLVEFEKSKSGDLFKLRYYF